jgi:hypothetical protein
MLYAEMMKQNSIEKSYGKMGLPFPYRDTEDSGSFITKEQEKGKKGFTENRITGKVNTKKLGKLNY